MERVRFEEEFARVLGAENRMEKLEELEAHAIEQDPVLRQAVAAHRQAAQIRYRLLPKTGRYADQFMEILQMILLTAGEGGFWSHKRCKKEVERWMKKIGALDEMTRIYEWFNVVYLYLHLCERDKTFGSVLFGLGRKKPEAIREKMQNLIRGVCLEVPVLWLQQATELAWNAYTEQYPIQPEREWK